ncbi:hypothetical protein D0469_19055 [Peribacillus saganii]|uniref:LysM domain-containing protein n=1 Tax=Peribacillus saganii TaxID=2303992 RepID=A0A372LEL1_9BACI|nr:hypothetical protein [Peribacillus saganii]RFU64302.1 hypothetical protein D0469_19055 [Peribacillus saganii]
MKRLALFLTIVFISYIIYVDVTKGTLPGAATETAATEEVNTRPSEAGELAEIPFKKIKIQPGDTLLSLVEKNKNGSSIDIQTIIKDFQLLNNGLKPEEMKSGSTYKVPSYR